MTNLMDKLKGKLKGKGYLLLIPVMAVVLVIGIVIGRSSETGLTALDGSPAYRQEGSENVGEIGDDDFRIGYDETAICTDPETLQKAVDEMYARAAEPGVALEYKNVAVSDDGENFVCYLGNSADNAYDMFFSIYADQQLQDEIFVSKLLRPGYRLEEMKINRKLAPGTYTVYIANTQVKDEENEENSLTQVIQAQIVTTMEFIVNEY